MRARRETDQSLRRRQLADASTRRRALAGALPHGRTVTVPLTHLCRLGGALCLALGLSAPVVVVAAPAPAPARTAGGSARVSLLPSGPRASVLVELDDTDIGATAIEATDNHTVAVEIGPVHGKVVNQLLQAAENSPLVSQVRVSGITQGSDGTLVTIHITAKAPISGSVRRTARRIYIDLEPRTAAPALKSTTPPSPVPAPATPAAPRASAPVNARADVTPPVATKPAAQPLAKTTAPAPPSADVPARPAAAVAPVTTNAKAGSVDELNKRADKLRRSSDIKGLEKLREDVAKQPTGMEMSDASKTVLLAQVDSYLDEARRQRLLNDAALFRSQAGNNVMAAPAPGGSMPPPVPSPAPGSETPTATTAPVAPPVTSAAAAPATAASPGRPAPAGPSAGNSPRVGAPADSALAQAVQDVRTMKASLLQWQPGYVPAPTFAAQAQALSLRLQQLTVPPQVAIPMSSLTAALVNLASTWVPSPDGSMIPFRNDALEVERTKTAMDAFLDAVAAQQLSAQR